MTAKNIIIRFWKFYLLPKIYLVILCFTLLVLVSLSFTLYPAIIGWVFDAIEAGDTKSLTQLSFFLISVAFLKAIVVFLQITNINKLVLSIIERIQNEMVSALINSDIEYILSQPSGHFVSRLTNDLNMVRDALVRVINNFVKDSLTLIAMICLMAWYNWILALLVLIIFPIAVFPIVKIGLKQRVASLNLQEHLEKLLAQLAETINNILVIKSYNLENYEKNRSKDNFNVLFKSFMKIVVGRARTEPIFEILGGIAIGSVILVGSWNLLETNFGVGDFAGFITAMLLMIQPARGLGSFNTVFQEGLAASKRIFELIDIKPKIFFEGEKKDLNFKSKDIIFDNVTFSYNEKLILDGISFVIPSGKTTAIVGTSGSGKSTILRLIARFYEAKKGDILFGSEDIKSLNLLNLRQNIAFVPQENFLFNDTLFKNISFGKKDAKFAEIKEAAKAAAADEFINDFPEKYDKIVGQNGNLLSGGQRQRISIARAFLKNAPILLLDEATSSLDSESEKKIQTALDNLSIGKTTIIVSHRLSTIRAADNIIVLDKGKIIEIGDHKKLFSKNGFYTNLCKLQFIGKDK